MVVRRQPGKIRGTRVGAGTSRSSTGSRASGSAATPDKPTVRERLAHPEVPREVIDHTLSRNAAVADWHRTGGLDSDACDADPYLIRAAKWHGEPTTRACPICAKQPVVELTYVFSKELGAFSGRLYPRQEIATIAKEHGVLRVFVVEVCQGCHWNHVITSFVVGDGIPRRPKRRPSDMEW